MLRQLALRYRKTG